MVSCHGKLCESKAFLLVLMMNRVGTLAWSRFGVKKSHKMCLCKCQIFEGYEQVLEVWKIMRDWLQRLLAQKSHLWSVATLIEGYRATLRFCHFAGC